MKNLIYFLPRNTSYEMPGSTDNFCLLKLWDLICCLFVSLHCIECFHVLYQLWPAQQTNTLLSFPELLREAIPKKICFCLVFFRRGGVPDSKTLRNFSAYICKFLRRGGGLPDSKDEEEHFCFDSDIFQGKFGGITKVQTLWGTLYRIKSV